jgi:pimeloyl-ACP methyl ester carboxylesterase
MMNTIALVLLHGYPFDHTMWHKVGALLATRVLTPDLRGFGQTRPGTFEPSLDLMADDIVKRLDEQEISRAIVAGFSMGGYVALSFAERHPQRLAGLGLINSQTLPDTEEGRAGRRAMIDKVRRDGPRAATDAAIPKLFSPKAASKDELTRFALNGAEQAGVAGIAWALEAMARRPDRTSVLERLGVPVLLIHSTEDQFIPVTRARALAEQVPGALYIEIAGSGHCSPLEEPELVAKGLGELVTRVESQSSQGLEARDAIKHQ